MVTQGYTATLVAATLAISRSSLYYQKKPRSSRADRTYDEQIIVACGEKWASGYRRVAWWLQRKKGLPANRKRVLRVMRERGCWCAHVVCAHAGKKSGAAWKPPSQSDLAVGHDQDRAAPAVGWSYLVCVIDCCTREMVVSLPSLPERRRVGGGRASGAGTAARGQPRSQPDADRGQRDAVHFVAVLRNARASRHHAPADGVSSPRRQQLHRTVPSQLERRGSLDGGVSQCGGSSNFHRLLNPGVQSRPASSRSRKSYPARGMLEFCSCTKKRGPDCLNWRGALQRRMEHWRTRASHPSGRAIDLLERHPSRSAPHVGCLPQ